jgi:hypothetical protein
MKYFTYTVLKTQTMKKIEKQPPVRPETPVSQVHYVFWYERHSSYRRVTGKKLSHHQ